MKQFYLLFVLTQTILSEITTEQPENPEIEPMKTIDLSSTTSNKTEDEIQEQIGEQESSFNTKLPDNISINKNIQITLLQKLNPHNFLRPFQEKWKEIQGILTYPFHPNFGGFLLLSPQHIFGKLKDKTNFIKHGPHASIFGLSQPPSDYPFAYRTIN